VYVSWSERGGRGKEWGVGRGRGEVGGERGRGGGIGERGWERREGRRRREMGDRGGGRERLEDEGGEDISDKLSLEP